MSAGDSLNQVTNQHAHTKPASFMNISKHHSGQARQSVGPLDWSQIDCVFLDMDGTLLDLNYDNLVWNQLVPQAYAEQLGVDLVDAQQRLLARMREIYGTIDFYSFEYWTKFTGADLIAAHEQATHLIDYRPGALAFLRWLTGRGCPTIIATNAHPDSIQVKDTHANICAEVDAVVSSHEFAAPKEDHNFWHALLREHPHDPARCLFIDDNEPVLDAAADFGIQHLRVIATPDSQRPTRTDLRYPSFDDFADLYD